ncbi:hypothetical protein OK016_14650 [Vibrio chagasii]|nr:hypothetical protein [Vibrio chagasii]
MVRSYIDWMVAFLGPKRSKVKNLAKAEEILNEDHYGLERRVKERILEYLAVQNRINKAEGQSFVLLVLWCG